MENTFSDKKDYVRGNDVIGLKVITIAEGKELHPVQDLIYDPQNHMVRALLIDEAGLFHDANIILFEDIASIGDDAVMIESDELLRKAGDVDQPIAAITNDNQYLTKTKIITEEGKELGKVQDIEFDPATGRVLRLEVSSGLFNDFETGIKMVNVDDIITIGKDATIVRKYTEEYVDEQAQNQGVQGAVNQVASQTPVAAEKAKQTASKLTEKARKKFEEFKDRPETQDYISNAEYDLSSYKQDLSDMAEKGKEKVDDLGEYSQYQGEHYQSQAGALGGRSVVVKVERHKKSQDKSQTSDERG